MVKKSPTDGLKKIDFVHLVFESQLWLKCKWSMNPQKGFNVL